MARTTLIMVVVFLALAGGAFVLDRNNPAKAPDTQVYVLEVKDTDVQRVEVRTGTGSQAFERAEPFGWNFASGATADLSRVSSVANRVSKLRSSAKVGENLTDLAPYGLSPAPISATLTMKDGATHRVLIGSKTVNDAAFYAMVEGTTTLHTINTLLVGDIEKLVSDPPVPTPTPDPSASATPRPTDIPTPTPRPMNTPGPDTTPSIGIPRPANP